MTRCAASASFQNVSARERLSSSAAKRDFPAWSKTLLDGRKAIGEARDLGLLGIAHNGPQVLLPAAPPPFDKPAPP